MDSSWQNKFPRVHSENFSAKLFPSFEIRLNRFILDAQTDPANSNPIVNALCCFPARVVVVFPSLLIRATPEIEFFLREWEAAGAKRKCSLGDVDYVSKKSVSAQFLSFYFTLF